MLVALGDSREQVLETAMKSRVCASMALGAPAEAWRAHGLEHPLGGGHGGFLDLVPTRVTAEQIDQAAARMTPALLLTLLYAGSVQQICDEAAPLVEAGCTHFILANAGASFGGAGARGVWRFARLMRRLRRL